MKIMVAYDGTVQSKEALVHGMERAREKSGEVMALHVFNNTLFIDYDVMDAETAARKESRRLLEEAKALIREKGKGVRVGLFSTEGNPEEEIIGFAKMKKADILLCPPAFRGIISKYRKAQAASEPAGEAAKTGMAELSAKMMQ